LIIIKSNSGEIFNIDIKNKKVKTDSDLINGDDLIILDDKLYVICNSFNK